MTIAHDGTLGEVRVLSGGSANLDFVTSSNGSCNVGQAYHAGDTCSLPITFQPKYPGGRSGAVVLLSTSGTVIATQPLYGTGSGPLAIVTPGTIRTVAGDGLWLYRSDNVPATQTSIYLPGGVVLNAAGDMYISDTGNNRIRRVDAQTSVITTIAGTGTPGDDGNGNNALNAQINSPGALALDGAGNLYIADSSNHAIRKLDMVSGQLTTVVGTLGVAGAGGDGGPASAATLNTPQGLAFDSKGNLYIADTANNKIRRVDAATGIITTIAGDGQPAFAGDGGPATAAELYQPWGISFDSHDNLFVADLKNNRIREITTDGKINTVIGTGAVGVQPDGTTGLQTNVRNPAAVVVDLAGNINFADTGNNIIRKLSIKTGVVTTIVGNGNTSFDGDGDLSTKATIYGPYSLIFSQMGDLYFSDIFHHRIREVQNSIGVLHFDAIRVGRTSDPQNVTIENDGNADLSWTSFDPDLNSAIDATKSTCQIGTAVISNDTCVVAAEFAPQVIGTDVKAAIKLNSNAANSPDTIQLDGEVDELEPTKTSLTSTPNPSAYGANVTFTAVVSGDGNPAPSGTVRFLEGSTILGTGTTNASGAATFTTNSLSIGSHTITAAFTGDTTNSPSTSAAIVQVVKQAATVTVTSNLNPAKTGQTVTFTATVSATQMQPTGTVEFLDGTTTIGTANVNAGIATVSTNLLAAGTHDVTAVYSGDTNTMQATSPVLKQEIDKWSTITTVSTSGSPVNIGENVTFTVNVTPTSTTTPAGTVLLKDGANTIATLTLNAQGSATYSTTALTVGDHSITATYQGDNTNDASTSSTLTQTISKIATTTSLASSPNPSNGGAVVHFTATVVPSTTNTVAGALSGTVTFSEGATTLGTVSLAANGTAVLDLSSLPVGTHAIVASYSGNGNYDVSTSAALQQQVVLAATTTQVTSSLNPSIVGNNVTFAATVAGNGGVPTGTVTFLDGGASIGTAPLNNGAASLTASALAAGSHTITVRYEGDAKNTGSTSAPLTQTVNQATTAIGLTSSNNPAVAGTTITFTASLTSNGSIPSGQIVLKDGANTIGTAAISATGSAQFAISNLGQGTHPITASFAGDAGHAASTSPVLNQVVNIGSSAQVITSSSNPSVFNDAVTFTVHVTGSGNQPTGSVTLTDGATALGTVAINGAGIATFTTSTLSIGSHTITSQYAGDTTHAAASAASIVQRVLQATTTTVVSSVNPSIAGQTVRFTATVVGASGQPVTGTVAFTDGGTAIGIGQLNASGVATLDTSSLTVGGHPIVATYSGDATNNQSTSAALQQTVNSASTSVTLISSTNPAVVGTPVTFTATVTSAGKAANGTVAFLDGSNVLGTSPIANGQATFTTSALAAGQHAIVARYNGGEGTDTSVSAVLIQVEQATTQVALTASPNPSLTAEAVTLSAQLSGGASATGTITFLDGTTTLGSATITSTGTAQIVLSTLGAGSHSLTATYSGDATNLRSTSQVVTQVVNKRATTTAASASSNTYKIGDQVTLIGVVKFDGPVAPSGSITFSAGGTTIGTSPIGPTGVATFSFTPALPQYNIVATYSGDGVYEGSTSAPYSIAEGENTTFTMLLNPSSVTLNSGDHTTVTLTFQSMQNFTDTLALGCLELPYAATCTFSKTKFTLAANGTETVQLTLDTGNPLGSGPRAAVRSDKNSNLVEAGILLPAGLLMGVLLFFARRKRALAPLLIVAMLVLAGLGMTGCGNHIDVNATPPGTYTVRVVASGTGTGANRVADLNVIVK